MAYFCQGPTTEEGIVRDLAVRGKLIALGVPVEVMTIKVFVILVTACIIDPPCVSMSCDIQAGLAGGDTAREILSLRQAACIRKHATTKSQHKPYKKSWRHSAARQRDLPSIWSGISCILTGTSFRGAGTKRRRPRLFVAVEALQASPKERKCSLHLGASVREL